jgi:hypothetical protein
MAPPYGPFKDIISQNGHCRTGKNALCEKQAILKPERFFEKSGGKMFGYSLREEITHEGGEDETGR